MNTRFGSGRRIEPARLAWLEALAESDAAFTREFGIPVAPGWIGSPEALPYFTHVAEVRDADPWGSYVLFDDDGTLVGLVGFKGSPDDGTVEIGYSVAPDRQGWGLATFAARQLIDRARAAGVVLVLAHTVPELSPSTSVLTTCEFRRTGLVDDPDGDEGLVWRWELPLS